MRAFVDHDRLILDLGSRRFDAGMTCGEAEKLVHALRAGANSIDEWLLTNPPTMLTESWELKVLSYDGAVWIRFYPPRVGATTRVPLTADAARKLADRVEFAAQQAAYKMRFELAGGV